MTGRPWPPAPELDRLLDALIDMLLGAWDHEVAATLRDMGEDGEAAAAEMRRLVQGDEDGTADAYMASTPVREGRAPGPRLC